jgi:hypothetical protein
MAAMATTALVSACGGADPSGSSTTAAVTVVPASTPAPAPTPTPIPTSSPTPTATALTPQAASFQLGINVAPSVYYGTERTFANLAYAASNWDSLGADKLNSYSYPASTGIIQLNVPQPVWGGTDTRITCTWKGSGSFFIDGDRSGDAYGDHTVSTTWRGWNGSGRPQMYLQVSNANTTDPLRDLDCREPGVVANGVFDQRIIDDLKPYGVLRFLDWSSANGNPASVTWATRTTPDQIAQSGPDGVAIENMVDLANATNSDAWFTVPYNADETYVRNMAKLVHDRLSIGHRAYFELSNETWNYGFGVAAQVLNEGIAENLSSDKYTNGLYRYAEKSTWMHKLLTDAFKDNPARLVRVVNTATDNTWMIDRVMEFKDTAQYVDAIATAPYFGVGFFDGANAGVTDLPTLFASLETMRVQSIDRAVANKATADKWGKRYITYEAGQHIIAPSANAATQAQMERSPMMYDMYKRYIADWKAKIGDTMILYSATGPISQYGAWGIREYAGQPLSDTPKRRAALEYTR